eukprot:9497376-Pyramimonas_sp.AAC.1
MVMFARELVMHDGDVGGDAVDGDAYNVGGDVDGDLDADGDRDIDGRGDGDGDVYEMDVDGDGDHDYVDGFESHDACMMLCYCYVVLGCVIFFCRSLHLAAGPSSK